MCTSFAKDLKRWTCDEERTARDAMLDGWAQALHEAAQATPVTATRDAADAAAPGAGASMPCTPRSPAASTDVLPPPATVPAR